MVSAGLGVEVIGGFAAFEIVLIVDESDIVDTFGLAGPPILYRLFRYILKHEELHQFDVSLRDLRTRIIDE